MEEELALPPEEARRQKICGLINLTSRCNQDCVFCCDGDIKGSGYHLTFEEAQAKIFELAAQGCDSITFIGGEPLLIKELPDLIRLTRGNGMRAGLTTNGTLLDEALLGRLVEAGLTSLEISVHSLQPELADRISRRPGTAEKQERALARLTELHSRPGAWPAPGVSVNFVLFSQNFRELPDFVRRIAGQYAFIDELFINFLDPIGYPAHDQSLVPRYRDVAETLGLALGLAALAGLPATVDTVPACVLGRHFLQFRAVNEKLRGVLYAKRTLRIENPNPDPDRSQYYRVNACHVCPVSGLCPGVNFRYLAIHGQGEFRPFDPGLLTQLHVPAGLDGAAVLNMLAVTGDHKCKRQKAKCKVQNGQASWLSATIRLRTRLRRDFGDHPPSHEASAGLRRPSAFAGRFGGTSSTITYDRRSTRFCMTALGTNGPERGEAADTGHRGVGGSLSGADGVAAAFSGSGSARTSEQAGNSPATPVHPAPLRAAALGAANCRGRRSSQRTDIVLTGLCNNHCRWCPCRSGGSRALGPGKLTRELTRLAAVGPKTILLTGGEPALHPGFLRIVQALAGAGHKVGFTTNGRLFSQAGRVAQVVAAGAAFVRLRLPAPWQTMDEATGIAGAAEQAREGLANLLACRSLFVEAEVGLPANMAFPALAATLTALAAAGVFRVRVVPERPLEAGALGDLAQIAAAEKLEIEA
jgi:MoaA/NifB/PqqE/SkfB family radical SAM enzyme